MGILKEVDWMMGSEGEWVRNGREGNDLEMRGKEKEREKGMGIFKGSI